MYVVYLRVAVSPHTWNFHIFSNSFALVERIVEFACAHSTPTFRMRARGNSLKIDRIRYQYNKYKPMAEITRQAFFVSKTDDVQRL
jgi:hypothetical protein